MHFFPQIPPHPYAINLDPILFCTLMGPMRKFTGCCRIFYSNGNFCFKKVHHWYRNCNSKVAKTNWLYNSNGTHNFYGTEIVMIKTNFHTTFYCNIVFEETMILYLLSRILTVYNFSILITNAVV